MKMNRPALALALSTALLGLTACNPKATDPQAAEQANANESADEFIARVNRELTAVYPETVSSQWLASTYINSDSELISAKANERYLAMMSKYIAKAKTFPADAPMTPATARSLHLLKIGVTLPPPNDPAALAELTGLATKLEGMYGSGKYCPDPKNPDSCLDIGAVSAILADPTSSYDQQLAAWQGWHTISPPMRQPYQQFVALSNQGAKDLGFGNTGELWRSGYDMSPADFQKETDRLWGQVEPLYKELQCYTKNKLVQKYGDKGQINGMIPAHLTGNLWQQDWGNLWPILEPYQGAGSLDINSVLQKQHDKILADKLAKAGGAAALPPLKVAEITREADLESAKQMARLSESFYTGLGMPKLPDSHWVNSQFIKPRDRDVVCHASAWDLNLKGDVRIKMCITPTEEDLTTLYHEYGHVYYFLAYNPLPILFQNGAHDGFHEAIGDTIVLSMTPEYMSSIGLVDKPSVTEQAVINGQMRMALAKVAFMPFGLMIDRWRWGVFDGSIKPDQYNKAWWDLKAKYQGVAPSSPRGEDFFDPGAKYHVPGNTPYTRYFLSHILQFQFYKALCDASGFKGPLYQCNYAANPEAGKRYWAMLSKGASQPWQKTMKELTGKEEMDGSAVLEYFAPLQSWLKEQNQGQQCGWQAPEV
jgi:peptidyl-dipeptidase A